jgi:hypothetical protein
MSAVVSFVEDAFEAVGDVFEAVGDVVEDVVDFVGDAVEKVGDVVQAVIDDPLPVLLSVAGSFVGIPPAITMGAVTAARGGDLEDIALSMGTAYFAPQVGSALSSTVSSAFIDAGFNEVFNETFTQVASDSISKGFVNGTIAEIKGGSFEDGFAGGFTGGMVQGGVGEVASYVKPDVIELAMDSGLDLREATSVFNAGTRAFSAGITSEVTGRGDFATSFTNSAIGSGIDAGTRSLNTTIDEQFRTAATDWNEKEPEGEPVEVATTGAGIPNEVVGQVTVSGYGVENDAGTFNVAEVLAESQNAQETNNATSSYTGEKATSDISILPETELAKAPQAETIYDFADTIDADNQVSGNNILAETPVDTAEVPESVIDIAKALPEEAPPVVPTEPVGGLNALADATIPAIDLDTSKPAVISEAPVGENLLTAGLAAEKPEGGLNAVSQTGETTPEAKMASSLGLKATDFTKPMVATVGNLLKQTLTQPKRPAPRAPVRPAGGLQMAGARPMTRKAPPARMDIANLIPIQKAAPVLKTATAAPAKTLGKDAKLTPITNIAGLTSQVKKTG